MPAGGSDMSALPLRVDPGLAEEVVLRLIRGHDREREFRRVRDRLYLLEPEGRESAFAGHHLTWFARLTLDQPVRAALAELPLLAEQCALCLMTRAPSSRDEGADLLVAPENGGREGRTVILRLRAAAFDDRHALERLLRSELLHVSDMVDSAFGYKPSLPVIESGPSHDNLVRQRYRVLWNVRVAGRLAARGLLDGSARASCEHDFAAAFPMLGKRAAETFARFFDGVASTHAELVAFAAAPRGIDSAHTLAPGGLCPLCRFPTYAVVPEPQGLDETVRLAIAVDFPGWRPSHGLCRQCGDLYAARISAARCSGPSSEIGAEKAELPAPPR
jgi:hypothetical protein